MLNGLATGHPGEEGRRCETKQLEIAFNGENLMDQRQRFGPLSFERCNSIGVAVEETLPEPRSTPRFRCK